MLFTDLSSERVVTALSKVGFRIILWGLIYLARTINRAGKRGTRRIIFLSFTQGAFRLVSSNELMGSFLQQIFSNVYLISSLSVEE